MKNHFLLFLAVCFYLHVNAQIAHPVKFTYSSKRIGENEAIIYINAHIEDGWQIYSLNMEEGGPIKTSIVFESSNDYQLVGNTTESDPVVKYDDRFRMTIGYFKREAKFAQKVKFGKGKVKVEGRIEYMVNNDRICLPPERIKFSHIIEDLPSN